MNGKVTQNLVAIFLEKFKAFFNISNIFGAVRKSIVYF